MTAFTEDIDAFIAKHLIPAPPHFEEYQREKTPPLEIKPAAPAPRAASVAQSPNNYPSYTSYGSPAGTSAPSYGSSPQPAVISRQSSYQNPDNTLIPGAYPAPEATLIPSVSMPKPIQIRLLPKEPQFFPVISKELATPVKVGRSMPETESIPNFIGYDTKVVSRQHAEIWSQNGEVFIKDTGSKSGSFLNNNRLSNPAVESRPFKLKDGDVLQFGVDFQGSQIKDHKSVIVTIYIVTGASSATKSMYGTPPNMNFGNLTLIGGGR